MRSDRGPEFKNALVKEFLALLGCRQAFGTAWRPMEQGIVERCHQELQKLLGLLVTDVVRSYPSEWTELLPVVEFMLYTTPGPHGFCPRDVDRRWSSALPLETELQPFEVMEFEPMAESVKKAFESYRVIRTKITGWYAATSERRAELANRHRKNRVVDVGSRVLYRDPRAKAVGGRTAWKEPLSGPCVVEAAQGNKLQLRRQDGVLVEAHAEDVIVLPADVELLERRTPLSFEAAPVEGDALAFRRSIGQMLTGDGTEEVSPEQVRRRENLTKLQRGSTWRMPWKPRVKAARSDKSGPSRKRRAKWSCTGTKRKRMVVCEFIGCRCTRPRRSKAELRCWATVRSIMA